MTLAFMGIDPGKRGAIALYRPGQPVEVQDVPLKLVNTNSRAGNPYLQVVDARRLHLIIQDWAPFTEFAVLERGKAYAGEKFRESAPKAFRYGKTCGMIEMALVACGIRYHLVNSDAWKGAMGLTSLKKTSIHLFHQLFGFRAKRSDRAEAALMAVYGARFLVGKEESR